jgi:hypothetical protein
MTQPYREPPSEPPEPREPTIEALEQSARVLLHSLSFYSPAEAAKPAYRSWEYNRQEWRDGMISVLTMLAVANSKRLVEMERRLQDLEVFVRGTEE